MEPTAVQMDRMHKRIAWLYLALFIATVLLLVIRVPLAVPSIVAGVFLIITTVVGVISLVILPLRNWVRLKSKEQVPIRHRVYEIVRCSILLIVPVYLLRDYFILPAPLALLLNISYGTTFLMWVLVALFSSYFRKP